MASEGRVHTHAMRANLLALGLDMLSRFHARLVTPYGQVWSVSSVQVASFLRTRGQDQCLPKRR